MMPAMRPTSTAVDKPSDFSESKFAEAIVGPVVVGGRVAHTGCWPDASEVEAEEIDRGFEAGPKDIGAEDLSVVPEESDEAEAVPAVERVDPLCAANASVPGAGAT